MRGARVILGTGPMVGTVAVVTLAAVALAVVAFLRASRVDRPPDFFVENGACAIRPVQKADGSRICRRFLRARAAVFCPYLPEIARPVTRLGTP
jgi:hypothetical protein